MRWGNGQLIFYCPMHWNNFLAHLGGNPKWAIAITPALAATSAASPVSASA